MEEDPFSRVILDCRPMDLRDVDRPRKGGGALHVPKIWWNRLKGPMMVNMELIK